MDAISDISFRGLNCKPFLACLDLDSLVNLDAALYYNHRQHIVPPAPEADIIPFNAAWEMSRSPEREDHLRST